MIGGIHELNGSAWAIGHEMERSGIGNRDGGSATGTCDCTPFWMVDMRIL